MKQRIVTGLIAAGLFIPFVLIGGLPFTVLVYALAAIALQELLRMKGQYLLSISGLISLALMFSLLIPSHWTDILYIYTDYKKIDFAFFAVLLLLIHTVVVKNTFTFEDAALSILGTLYIGIGFFYFIETRNAGLEYIVYALLVVWSTDSGAYFTGRKIGKRKLWPQISPNKTIEGFIGGIVWAVAAALLLDWFVDLEGSVLILVGVTIAAASFGQLGDLVESALKRHFGVKDSGTILPGHGGMLDRFDSLLFVLPLLHFLHFI
ncbi:phosphatidate cytidylyltransferase [Planococcus lenghuensis]|uniref:Phosphatidate cytidylyltransferase n=1 Tax=Planococcus lenghuensis TaxID=2213202 RepID=A0A1Q2L002_9BACL|nr:phosphatidate cytidylyltransferase [Planococcus lenghuensis]AQQ53726.1 phosphatidate cytidylyltransferase [Planococcus lenghuensis]